MANRGTVTFAAQTDFGRQVNLEVIISPDLAGLPLIDYRDLVALEVIPASFPYPAPSISTKTIVKPGNGDGDDMENHEDIGVDQIRVCVQSYDDFDPAFVEAELRRVTAPFSDVLGSSLGEASGGIKGPKMKIELDEETNVTTARMPQYHFVKMADKLVKELQQHVS